MTELVMSVPLGGAWLPKGDYERMLQQITDLQARNTELVEENRRLKMSKPPAPCKYCGRLLVDHGQHSQHAYEAWW